MGIQGLLPFLKKIHEPINVSRFAGCTVAIDAYCWLHKGAFSCAEKLALGEKTDQYVYYCLKFINYLLSKNIKPIMVFDGCHLPSKKNVEKTRREKRELNRKKAAQFLREGRRAEARECLQRCIDISPEMALQLMNACRDKGVDCIVAPYEADAQLAFLSKAGIAQLVITEDSDLLLFGCERVMFKMDHAGNGILIEQKRLNEVMDLQSAHFTFDKFRYMCILSGCDYLASLSGIGLVKANKVFKIARQADLRQLLKKLSTYLKANITVPQEYIDGFIAADYTFLYQLVFDPLRRKLVPLNPYSPDINKSELSYAGEYMPQQKALDLALGNINIYTGEKFADFNPDTFVPKYGSKKKPDMLHMLSIWDPNYRIRPRGALHERQEPDRPNLKGKEVVVRAHVRRSPHKRVREADGDQDAISNTELSSMYSDKSPMKKKPRREDVEDHLQRFLFAEDQQNNDTQSEEEDDQPRPLPGPSRSPRFFNSLSSAHPKVKVEGNEATEGDKENGIKSPRNRFACKSPAKKPRFSLNSAAVDVKSRFFTGSAKLELSRTPSNQREAKASSPAKSNKSTTDLNGFKPVHKNTLNLYFKNEPEKTNLDENNTNNDKASEDTNENSEDAVFVSEEKPKPFSFSKVGKTESQKSSPSPTSAFSWSKFKFNRNNSSEQLPQLDGYKATSSQFKKVVSESSLEKFFKKKPEEKTVKKVPTEMSYEEFLKKGDEAEARKDGDDCNVLDDDGGALDDDGGALDDNGGALDDDGGALDDSLESDKDTGLGCGLSQSSANSGSYPYSIDSACISQTDFHLDSQKSASESQNLSSDSQTKYSTEKNHQNVIHDELGKVKQDETPNVDTSGLDLVVDNNDNKSATSSGVNDKSTPNATKNVFKMNSIYFKSDNDEKSSEQNKSSESEPQEVVSLIDSDDDDNTQIINAKNSNISTPKNIKSSANSTSKNSTKSGCRVSGLRRGSKKQGKTAVDDGKQQNLRDMFSKFAHRKDSQPKLSHDNKNTFEEDKYTPEGATSSLGMKSGIQKRIL